MASRKTRLTDSGVQRRPKHGDFMLQPGTCLTSYSGFLCLKPEAFLAHGACRGL